jgi:hypothetical protein
MRKFSAHASSRKPGVSSSPAECLGDLTFTCIGIELQPDLTQDYFQKRPYRRSARYLRR